MSQASGNHRQAGRLSPSRPTTVIAATTNRRGYIRLAEAPSFGQSIFDYAPDSHGATDYQQLAEEVLGHGVSGHSVSGQAAASHAANERG